MINGIIIYPSINLTKRSPKIKMTEQTHQSAMEDVLDTLLKFVNSGGHNYIRIKGPKLASLRCLSCGVYMHHMGYWRRHGPNPGGRYWFCFDCDLIWHEHINDPYFRQLWEDAKKNYFGIEVSKREQDESRNKWYEL